MSQATLYLDVRTSTEFAERHLAHSLNIPLDMLQQRLGELGEKHRPIIVYCRSGRRSALAVALLRAAGFSRVRDAGCLERVEAS